MFPSVLQKKSRKNIIFFLFILLVGILFSISYCFFIPVRKAVYPKLQLLHNDYLVQLHRYVDVRDYEKFEILEEKNGTYRDDPCLLYTKNKMENFYSPNVQDLLHNKMSSKKTSIEKEEGDGEECGGPEKDGINCLNSDWTWVDGVNVPSEKNKISK